MGDTIGLAVAIAASPFAMLPAILLLFTDRPRASSSAFLAGWAGGLLVATTVAVLLSEVIETGGYAPAWVSWARLVAGVALVVFGVRQWFSRAAKAEPRWMSALSTMRPRAALRLGLLVSAANPKVLLMCVAAGITIGSSTVAPGLVVAWVLGFVAVASLSVAVPLAAFVILGERALPVLDRLRDWLQRNSSALMAVVITVIGVVLVTEGLSGL